MGAAAFLSSARIHTAPPSTAFCLPGFFIDFFCAPSVNTQFVLLGFHVCYNYVYY